MAALHLILRVLVFFTGTLSIMDKVHYIIGVQKKKKGALLMRVPYEKCTPMVDPPPLFHFLFFSPFPGYTRNILSPLLLCIKASD